MTTEIIKPTKKQWDLIRCPANEILWGGAAGGGKSFGILLDWSEHHRTYGSAAQGLILRRTNPQLEEILRMAKMLFSKIPGSPTWNDKQRQFNYPDGAFLRLGYLDNYDDVFNYVGHSFTARYHDELTAWGADDEYSLLNTRMRSTSGVKVRIVNTTNPGGPGHQWVMRRWKIDEHPQGYLPITTYSDVKGGKVLTDKEKDPAWDGLRDDELPDGIVRWVRMYIPARLEDNPHLDTDGQYRAQLMTKDKRLRAMLLEGRWDVIEGSFFAEWDPGVHVVQPFEIPKNWRRFVAMDWGTWSPYCVLWAAESPYGEVYIYRELYGMGEKPNQGVNEPPSVVADKILRIERMSEEYVHERYLDDSCWKGEKAGEVTIAQQFATAGVPFQPARRFNKVSAINNLKEWLKVVNGKSRLSVFNGCRSLIRTLPIIQIDRNNPDQYDTKAEDHACDALTYLMRRYMHDDGRKFGGSNAEDLNKRKIGVYSGMGVW